MEPIREIAARKSTLRQQGCENDLAAYNLQQRLAMVWPLTISAWAMKGENIASQRLQRHVERVKRRGC